MTDDGHLTERDVAEWLSHESDRAKRNEDVERHVAGCESCRGRVDRGDAMLDLAATAIDDDAVPSDCPDAIHVAGYADGKLAAVDVARLRQHFDKCVACSELLNRLDRDGAGYDSFAEDVGSKPGSSMLLRTWLAGGAMLAAAVLAIVVLIPKPSLVALDVNVTAAGNTRSAEPRVASTDFEVVIDLRKPAWITLLVVDSTGDVTFLEDRWIDDGATLGRYATSPPGSGNTGVVRKFVVVLVSIDSLKDTLKDVDLDPVAIGVDSVLNGGAMSKLCNVLAKRLDCEAHYAPIDLRPLDE